jgi:hypothetical protein
MRIPKKAADCGESEAEVQQTSVSTSSGEDMAVLGWETDVNLPFARRIVAQETLNSLSS